MIRKIEISIILFSKSGREININEIKDGINYFEDEVTPEYLWGSLGGIEVVTDGYKRILRCFEFYVSLNAIDFLMNSVFWMHGLLDKGFIDDDFPKCITSRLPTGNFLKICNHKDDTIVFSYDQTASSSFDSQRFFHEEILYKEEWEEAAFAALKDYFEILSKSFADYPKDCKSEIITDYLNQWNKLKTVANKT